jgi:hypothetical protein
MATPPPDTTWIGPAVIAAGVSAVVAIVGFICGGSGFLDSGIS